MSFRTRLFLTYFILIVLLVVLLGLGFYQYTANAFEENAYSNLSVISDKMSQQLDNLIHPIDLMITYLLSTENFMSSMTTLATLDKNNANNKVFITEARATVYSNIMNYATLKNFYRVSFFNREGDFSTSNFRVKDINMGFSDVIRTLEWIRQADNAHGRAVLIPPYTDPWAESQGTRVFGLARCIQGTKGGIGYLEVQQPYSMLKNIFAVPAGENIKVMAITKQGDLFYSYGVPDKELLDYYKKSKPGDRPVVSVLKNPSTGRDEIVTCVSSNYTGVSIMLVQDRSTLLKPLSYTIYIMVAVGILILLLSLGYIYIFARQLAKPVRQLKEKMENTELENLPDKLTFESSNNEFQSLNRSFQRLRERLNDALMREIKSHSLQMQANFDSLQAQVNPHFIYNILNVLSQRGMINGDEEICNICGSIASMLRYSTSTQKRTATVRDELEHVRNYLVLMKKRYEHRLVFDIDVDPGIYQEIIPKIVLQQIVENSLNHGFEAAGKIMEISIKGHIKDNWWFFDMEDNGQGFDPDILKELQDKMESIEEELSKNKLHSGYTIGGMGLLNTYARMVLFYERKFIFKLANRENGGARVSIGGIIGWRENQEFEY